MNCRKSLSAKVIKTKMNYGLIRATNQAKTLLCKNTKVYIEPHISIFIGFCILGVGDTS
jgi:hypothetical protein